MTNSQNNKWEEIKRKSEEMESKNTAETEEERVAVEKIADEATENTQEQKIEYVTPEELEQKLTTAEKTVEHCRNEVLRAKAEADNFRRRAERDIANAHKYALEKMAFELLPVVDNLERCLENKAPIDSDALKNIYMGVELTLKAFLEVLQKFEIKQLNPVGEVFNPEQHTAMMTKEDPSVKPNTVLQVMQKGYILKDRLLRPAMVVVVVVPHGVVS